jgi:hypothetical protein
MERADLAIVTARDDQRRPQWRHVDNDIAVVVRQIRHARHRQPRPAKDALDLLGVELRFQPSEDVDARSQAAEVAEELCLGDLIHGRPPLEHDPEKWEPVFGKDHAQTKI